MDKFMGLIYDLDNKLETILFNILGAKTSDAFDEYFKNFEDIKKNYLSNIREEFFKFRNTDFIVNGVYEIINIYLIDIDNYICNILKIYNNDIDGIRDIIKKNYIIFGVIDNLVDRFGK